MPHRRQTVIAGPPEQVDAVIAVVGGQNGWPGASMWTWPRIIAMIDPILPELRMELSDLAPKTPTIPFISTGGHCRVRADVRCRLLGG